VEAWNNLPRPNLEIIDNYFHNNIKIWEDEEKGRISNLIGKLRTRRIDISHLKRDRKNDAIEAKNSHNKDVRHAFFLVLTFVGIVFAKLIDERYEEKTKNRRKKYRN